MATITTLFILAKLEGVYFNYNSYIPYLTFPIVSAFYLLATDTNKIIKLISFSALIIVSDYVLLSYSRQSFLFTIGCGFVFLSLNKEIVFFKKILFISIYIICVLISMKQLTKESNTDKLIQRYSIGNEYATESATDSFKNHPLVQNRSYRNKLKRNHTIKRVERVFNTTRLDIALDGIALLKPTEIITGVGLSSVVNSGPHNDYIRWMQRVGVLVMLVGFSPFFIAGWGAFCRSYQERKNGLQIYLFLAVCFTLFHSVFGYPREDAYQAVYCFLGLAMWLGISNKGGVLRRRQEPIKDNYVALLNQYAKE